MPEQLLLQMVNIFDSIDSAWIKGNTTDPFLKKELSNTLD